MNAFSIDSIVFFSTINLYCKEINKIIKTSRRRKFGLGSKETTQENEKEKT